MNPEDTVQQTELEHIRHHQFNSFNGEQVVTDLLNHPELWEKVWMESMYGESHWGEDSNPDTLHILAPDRDSASRLLELGAKWGSDGLDARQESDGKWSVSGWWD
jgi:hypothetical protein